jgi:hypothetical protein
VEFEEVVLLRVFKQPLEKIISVKMLAGTQTKKTNLIKFAFLLSMDCLSDVR